MSSAAVSVRSAAAAAAATNTTTVTPLFQLGAHHPLNFAAFAAHNKNSSIADLRLKAKKHAEALFGGERRGGEY